MVVKCNFFSFYRLTKACCMCVRGQEKEILLLASFMNLNASIEISIYFRCLLILNVEIYDAFRIKSFP
ncbi:hypothetical protein Syn8016DRAFT_1728 [Synechococcus sp. WH 8016]|nr:hypothetical protein Syn8016DRAFT_1728 [Synechococcus sp. WH 8016]